MAERIAIDTRIPVGSGHVNLAIDIPDVRCMTAADQRFVMELITVLTAAAFRVPALESG